MKFFLQIICAVFIILASISTIYADNYSISPIKNELKTNPGYTLTGEVTLFNGSDSDRNFEVYFEECIKNSAGVDCFRHGTGGNQNGSILQWLMIDGGSAENLVPSNKSKSIHYNIQVPKEAKAGSYFGVIKATEIKKNDITNKVRELGSLILLTVNGNIEGESTIGKITVSSSTGSIRTQDLYDVVSFLNPFPQFPTIENDDNFFVRFLIPIKNSSNFSIKPNGKIEITDMSGLISGIGSRFITDSDQYILGSEIIDFLPINESQQSILPNSDMILNVEWRGFAYNKLNALSSVENIGFHSPGKYFSEKLLKKKVAFPFFKVISIKQVKHLNARIEIGVSNGDIYSKNIPFSIEYTGLQMIPNNAFFFWIHKLIPILFR